MKVYDRDMLWMSWPALDVTRCLGFWHIGSLSINDCSWVNDVPNWPFSSWGSIFSSTIDPFIEHRVTSCGHVSIKVVCLATDLLIFRPFSSTWQLTRWATTTTWWHPSILTPSKLKYRKIAWGSDTKSMGHDLNLVIEMVPAESWWNSSVSTWPQALLYGALSFTATDVIREDWNLQSKHCSALRLCGTKISSQTSCRAASLHLFSEPNHPRCWSWPSKYKSTGEPSSSSTLGYARDLMPNIDKLRQNILPESARLPTYAQEEPESNQTSMVSVPGNLWLRNERLQQSGL